MLMKSRVIIALVSLLFLSLSTTLHAKEKIRDFLPGAAKRNHVVIVNVGQALPEVSFAKAARLAASRVNLNIWTNSIPKSIVMDLIRDPALLQKTFGPKCRVAVFVEKNAIGPSFLQAPGCWSLVNLRGLDKDKPDEAKLADRYAKMILKGLGHACGGGASLDANCSLFYGSFTLQGMDKTKLQISPMTYFPMLETLRQIGGHEILSPEMEQQ